MHTSGASRRGVASACLMSTRAPHSQPSSPANGSAEWPPDDRLQRTIQYSTSVRDRAEKLRRTGSPAFAGDDDHAGSDAERLTLTAYSWSGFLPPMFFSLANTASTLRSSRCFSDGSNSGSLRVVLVVPTRRMIWASFNSG